MITIDHKELAVSRLAHQFKNSTNLINYIKTLLIEANTLEDVFQSLIHDRTIETATDATLDIIGAIVGQARLYDDSNTLIDDDLYRLHIKARIKRNTSQGLAEDLIDWANFIFNSDLVMYDGSLGRFSLGISKKLSSSEIALVRSDALGKPLGVRFDTLITFDQDSIFGFAPIANAKGFGDVNDPSAGGKFAEIVA